MLLCSLAPKLASCTLLVTFKIILQGRCPGVTCACVIKESGIAKFKYYCIRSYPGVFNSLGATPFLRGRGEEVRKAYLPEETLAAF